MTDNTHGLGERIVGMLGEPAARELLDALTRSDADRASPTTWVLRREGGEWKITLFHSIPLPPES